jgi:hypothetical protein
MQAGVGRVRTFCLPSPGACCRECTAKPKDATAIPEAEGAKLSTARPCVHDPQNHVRIRVVVVSSAGQGALPPLPHVRRRRRGITLGGGKPQEHGRGENGCSESEAADYARDSGRSGHWRHRQKMPIGSSITYFAASAGVSKKTPPMSPMEAHLPRHQRTSHRS